jgi:hypothetical protein
MPTPLAPILTPVLVISRLLSLVLIISILFTYCDPLVVIDIILSGDFSIVMFDILTRCS